MAAALIEKWYRLNDWIGDWLVTNQPTPGYSLLDHTDRLAESCEACDEEDRYEGLKRDYPA